MVVREGANLLARYDTSRKASSERSFDLSKRTFK